MEWRSSNLGHSCQEGIEEARSGSEIDPLFTFLYPALCPRRPSFIYRINVFSCSLDLIEFDQWVPMVGYQMVRREWSWLFVPLASSLLCLFRLARSFYQRSQLQIIVTLSVFSFQSFLGPW